MQDADLEKYFEANKQAWDRRTTIHKDSAFYDVPSFINGKTTLNEAELKALGDVQSKTLLHLQCHFGLDTLSWARKGALVTGIDFSEEAIKYGRQLSDDLNIEAIFIACNVYDLPKHLNQQFDIVFTSYGVLGWLPDLDTWASVVAHHLKPGGIFFLAEFHPIVWMMDEQFERIKYAYHNKEIIIENQSGTYADRLADISYKEYSWNHSLSEVINSLIKNGLQIVGLDEYPYSYYNCFNQLEQGVDGFWRVKGMGDKMPMMYGLKAIKPLVS